MSIFKKLADKFLNDSQSEKGGSDLAPIEDLNDQSSDEVKIVSFVREKLDDIRQQNQRIALDGNYLTNTAYLLGFDGVYYDSNFKQFKNSDSKRRLTRNRFRINKILPTIQNRLARMTQSPPKYDVRPNSNSTEDKDAARLGLDIVNDIFDRQRFREKIQELHMAAMQGGHAFVQVSWDPSLGNPMYDPETNEFLGYEGDVRLEVLNCLEWYPDPLAKSQDSISYGIKAKVRRLQYFKDNYERGDAVKEEDTWLLSSIYDMRANALSSTGITGASTNVQTKNSAIELVYYEKRSKDYPNGRMIVCANGVLLEDKELPIGEFDVIKFDDILVGGRYAGEAVITHLRPIQDQYNITRTKCADWIKAMLAGKYLVAKGSELGQEALNNGSGEVVEYSPVPNAPPPTVMPIPMIPQYVYKDLETLDKEFDFISGINEISRGVLPSASIPAAGMAFLQEQDQTRIGVSTTRNEIGYSKVASCALKYVSNYYKIPRILKIAGEGLEYTVKEFVGEDIRDNFDIIVVPGSTVPQSRVLRRQDILSAYQLGLLGDPADPKLRAKVLSMMEYGYAEDMWKDQSLDEAQVHKMIGLIEENKQEDILKNLSEFDNQEIHLYKMNQYRKTDKYSNMSDDIKAVFDWVMEWRLQALVNLQNPQLKQQKNVAQLMMNNLEQMGGLAAMPTDVGQVAQGDINGGFQQPGPPPNPTALPQQQMTTI